MIRDKIKKVKLVLAKNQLVFSHFCIKLKAINLKMSTARDKAILNSILNPFFPLAGDYDEENFASLNDEIQEETNEILEAKKIEREAIKMAEEGNVKEAIEALTKAINLVPTMPSLLNNRAQAYRLQEDLNSALKDLNDAILISKGKGRSACQAFCQRGLIYKKNGEDAKAMNDFKRAAQLGSPFAKVILVQANPYAALCNDMLTQIMAKLSQPQ